MTFTADQLLNVLKEYRENIPSKELLEKATDFRGPELCEFFISINPGNQILKSVSPRDKEIRRLIVPEERPPVKETEACVITIGDVYGGPVYIPDDYVFVGFRIPGYNEPFLTAEYRDVRIHSDTVKFSSPRIIVRPR